jgi:hypothetical protein
MIRVKQFQRKLEQVGEAFSPAQNLGRNKRWLFKSFPQITSRISTAGVTPNSNQVSEPTDLPRRTRRKVKNQQFPENGESIWSSSDEKY